MVSVIMNTVNERRDYLSIAIESYLNQKGIEFELIISTIEGDPNISFVKNKYPFCRVVTMPRKDHPISKGKKSPLGSFLQLNNALKVMRGDWFTFASGNDFAKPFKLSLEVETAKRAGALVCYSSYSYCDEIGRFKGDQLFHPYDRDKHSKGNFVADCSMISRKIVDDFLPFNTALNNYAYWDLWLRVHKIHGNNAFVYNKKPTWFYRQDSNSMHVQRFNDPKALEQYNKERVEFLKLHK